MAINGRHRWFFHLRSWNLVRRLLLPKTLPIRIHNFIQKLTNYQYILHILGTIALDFIVAIQENSIFYILRIFTGDFSGLYHAMKVVSSTAHPAYSVLLGTSMVLLIMDVKYRKKPVLTFFSGFLGFFHDFGHMLLQILLLQKQWL
jgi:hypothetical protein